LPRADEVLRMRAFSPAPAAKTGARAGMTAFGISDMEARQTLR